jgi:uncharacterized protein DUF5132
MQSHREEIAMRIHPMSFVLGVGAAIVMPLLTRVLRPLAVEAAVASMGLFDEGRRIAAEQFETLEDIVAEARARREELLADGNGHHAEVDEQALADVETTGPAAPRRRANGRRRPA